MSKFKNAGYDPTEIEELKAECKAEGQHFVYVEDEEGDLNGDELKHIQFVGKYNDQPVIYDALIYTLRLHHSGLVYEKAVELAQKVIPSYLPLDERDEDYEISPADEEEAELMITELIETLEEDEEVKVQEHIEYDVEFEYGIGLEVALNVEYIDDEMIETFINDFKNGAVKLDNTLYSFKTEEED